MTTQARQARTRGIVEELHPLPHLHLHLTLTVHLLYGWFKYLDFTEDGMRRIIQKMLIVLFSLTDCPDIRKVASTTRLVTQTAARVQKVPRYLPFSIVSVSNTQHLMLFIKDLVPLADPVTKPQLYYGFNETD